MSLEQILAFYLFALVAAITPGPANVMIAAAGSIRGPVKGLPTALGTALGMGFLLFAAALGLGGLVAGHPALMATMKWAGAAVLLWLAWKIARAGASGPESEARAVGFLGAALFQWVNPKAWLVAVSSVGTYLTASAGNGVATAFLFSLVFVAAALPSNLVWLLLGAAMQRLLRDARSARAFNVAMGVLLALSVVMILV
jgi:Putative threonine efflux protein